MLMHWERVEALMAVVEHGGFSAAARALGKTQSAISQAVAQLERSLGEALVLRGEGGVTPTQAGTILLRHAVRAEDEMRAAEHEVGALSVLKGGRLHLAVTDTLGCYLLPPALTAFRAQYPAVELCLMAAPSPRCAELVVQRKADLAVVSLPLQGQPAQPRVGEPVALATGLSLLPLAAQPEVLLVAAGHTLAKRKRVSLTDVARQPLLMLGRDTAGRASLEARFAAEGLSVEPRMEANSVELLKTLVRIGLGVAVIPAMAVPAGDAAVTAVPLSPRDDSRWTAIALPLGRAASHAARAFAEVAFATVGAPKATNAVASRS